MIGYCACGRKLENTGDGLYIQQTYSSEGVLIHAVCSHGIVVVSDKKEEIGKSVQKDFQFEAELNFERS